MFLTLLFMFIIMGVIENTTFCIVLHCICIALHCIALHCIVLYCIVLYCSWLHRPRRTMTTPQTKQECVSEHAKHTTKNNRASIVTRGHNMHVESYPYTLSQRVVNDWNRLPEGCSNATSVNMFKNRIDQYLFKDKA